MMSKREKSTMTRIPATATVLFILHTGFLQAQETATQTPITNARVFDARSDARIENARVPTEGNLIKLISPDAIDAGDATIINGGDCTLWPRLIDVHWPMMCYRAAQSTVVSGGILVIAVRAEMGAE